MSIRGRLTIWFTLLFGLIVVALAMAAYVIAQREIYSNVDAGLQVAVGATAMSAEHELNEHGRQRDGETDLKSVLTEDGNSVLQETQILVREGNRNAAYKPGESGFDLRKLSTEDLRNGAPATGLRLARRSLSIDKFKTTYDVYAAMPIASAVARIHFIRTLLLMFVPLGLALAGMGGYLLAKRSLRPLNQLAGTVDGVTSWDMSTRVNLKGAPEEIKTLGSCFNALLDRLEQAFNSQRRFMADASHQIRTPVTVALAAVQIANHGSASSLREGKSTLEVLEKQMLRMRRLVEDMFFLSQADMAPLKFKRGIVQLDDVVEEAGCAAMALARQKQQTVTLRASPDAACLGDDDLLEQAVLILLDNAAKYTPAGGMIDVDLFRRESNWVCAVTDNGAGIPAEEQAHVFERFFRASRTRDAKDGAGLGLAIAKTIVEAHGGRLDLVESRLGRTTFEITLPAYDHPDRAKVPQQEISAVSM